MQQVVVADDAAQVAGAVARAALGPLDDKSSPSWAYIGTVAITNLLHQADGDHRTKQARVDVANG